MKKTKTKRKILAIALTVALVMQITALPIFAAGDGSGTGATQVDNYADFVKAVEDGSKTVKLTDNISSDGTVSSIDLADGVNINLNGYLLELDKQLVIEEGESALIRNGDLKINFSSSSVTSTGAILVNKSASFTMSSVNYETYGTAIYPSSDAATVTVTDSTVYGGYYGVATNASVSTNVVITLSDSTIGITANVGVPVMINVPGELYIDNCDIYGSCQGLIIRGGTAEVTDTTINIVEDGKIYDDKWDGDWGSGTYVPNTAVVIGNRSAGTSYDYPTIATFTNVEIINNGANTANQTVDIFIYGQDSLNNATLSMYGVTGDAEIYAGGESNVVAYEGIYSINPIYPVNYVPEGYATIENSDGTYTVSLVEDVVVDATTSGTASDTVNPTLGDDTTSVVFTEKELTAGNKLEVVLTVDEIDIDNIEETEKTAIEEAITNLSEEGVFAFVLDLTLEKLINNESTVITETNGLLTITIDIPEEYQAEGRVFSIVRVHDGVAEILEDLDDDPTTITFQTDKFSTYAVAYVDAETTDDVITVPDGYSVDTGDSTPYLAIGLLIIAMLGMATMIVRRRIQDNK